MCTTDLKDKAAQGFLWGAINNGAMQLLNAVCGIILARLLTKADYGLAGEVAIFSTIAAALQESGFLAALTNKKNATHMDYNAVFWFNITMSLCLFIVLFFCAPLIVDFFDEPELLWLSRYAFIGFFVASFSITPRAILFKQLRVKEQAIISVVSLLVAGTVGILMAWMLAKRGMGYWSIPTQNTVYVAMISILSWHYSGWKPSFKFSFRPIREMFGFSCRLLITNLFNCFNNSVFTFVFGYFYTKNEVGVYTQADKWNKMGSQLIIGMVQGVAQPMFVQVGNDVGRLQRVFRKMLRFTSFISFPAMFGLALVAPEFIVVLAGEEWLPSAELMQLLCVAGAFMPITTLYSNFMISRSRSDVYMWNILSQGLIVLGVLCAVKFFKLSFCMPIPSLHETATGLSLAMLSHTLSGIRLMVVSYVVIYITWLFLWHFFLWKEIRLSLWAVLKDILPFVLIATVVMGLTYICTRPIEHQLLLLLTRMVVAAVLYLAILWLLKAKILRESLSYLTKRKAHLTRS
ncbi:MAG: lipopolysaccharide biosynthesis protein [Bacteroidaceae bacterium]|nr:lipopolysaccharide biosynthesis protein [Bacteroidaceae bacterium]